MSTRRGLAQRAVFVDTGAYYALADPGDTSATVAKVISEHLIAERWVIYTSNFILAEIHALLLRRRGRAVALKVLEDLDQSPTTIERVTVADEARAREIITQYDDKNFSLTDATSFAVMERLGITCAFTFDRNFEQYGLTVLTPHYFLQR